MNLIETENLHKTYRIGEIDILALQGASVKIEQGEFVAIIGASGSGKSTLMHLLGLLDVPDKGTIKLMGRDVTRLTDEDYARLRNKLIGFVFQQFNLMTRSTALENVALPLWYSENEKTDSFDVPAAFLKQVGLENRVQHKPGELSGGQQQRVAIARALVNEPLLILADEPTGNLDSKSGKEIMDIFHALNKKGLTIVIVTHDSKVAEAAGRIIRMHDGKVAEDRRNPDYVRLSVPPLPKEILEIPAKKKISLKEIREHLQQAARIIFANKMRSLLSILGVLIGVACVITMLAIGRGARDSVTEQLSRLGSNLLSVRPGSQKVRGVSLEAGTVTWFTMDDSNTIKTLEDVNRVIPQVSGQGQLTANGKNWSTRLMGVTPDYALVRNQEPVMGRFFSEEENQLRKRVALLGQTVMRELFGEGNPVGQVIKINRVNFQVIGVLPGQGSNSFRDQDDLVVVPLTTAMKRVLGKEFLDEIGVEVASAEKMPAVQAGIEQVIIQKHQLTPDRYETFSIRNFSDVQAAMTGTTQTFSILLGCVSAISLLVGGIGIMNIMLVSVKERTREIGLRKALGATRKDILLQFLVESLVITFFGGVLGVVLAVLISWLITFFANWATVITIGSLFLAFFFSVAVGIIFGMWPAKQAADLEPIQALRYE